MMRIEVNKIESISEGRWVMKNGVTRSNAAFLQGQLRNALPNDYMHMCDYLLFFTGVCKQCIRAWYLKQTVNLYFY